LCKKLFIYALSFIQPNEKCLVKIVLEIMMSLNFFEIMQSPKKFFSIVIVEFAICAVVQSSCNQQCHSVNNKG
jgi:hypothetical protein